MELQLQNVPLSPSKHHSLYKISLNHSQKSDSSNLISSSLFSFTVFFRISLTKSHLENKSNPQIYSCDILYGDKEEKKKKSQLTQVCFRVGRCWKKGTRYCPNGLEIWFDLGSSQV